MRRSSTVLAIVLALAGASCAEDAVDPVDGTPLARIEVNPDSLVLGVGGTVQFEVEVLDPEGDPMEVEVVWSSTAPSVLTVDSGFAVAEGLGEAMVIVSADGLADTARVSVVPGPPLEPEPGTIRWSGNAGTSSWHEPSNWTPARVPLPSDTVFVPRESGTIVVSANATVAGIVIEPDDELGVQLEAGVVLTVHGDVLGGLSAGIHGGQLVVDGTGVRIAGPLPSTRIVGSAVVDGLFWEPGPYFGPEYDVDVTGHLEIEGLSGEGEFAIGDTARVRVSGDLTVRNAHLVIGRTMVGNTLYSGQLAVTGVGTFDGGDSRGHLTGGILQFDGGLTVVSCNALTMDPRTAVFLGGGVVDVACSGPDDNRLGHVMFFAPPSDDAVVEIARDVWMDRLTMRGTWDSGSSVMRYARFQGADVAVHLSSGVIQNARFDGVRLVWTAADTSAALSISDLAFAEAEDAEPQLTVRHPGRETSFTLTNVAFDPSGSSPYVHAEDTDAVAPVLDIVLTLRPANAEARTTTAGGAVVHWP